MKLYEPMIVIFVNEEYWHLERSLFFVNGSTSLKFLKISKIQSKIKINFIKNGKKKKKKLWLTQSTYHGMRRVSEWGRSKSRRYPVSRSSDCTFWFSWSSGTRFDFLLEVLVLDFDFLANFGFQQLQHPAGHKSHLVFWTSIVSCPWPWRERGFYEQDYNHFHIQHTERENYTDKHSDTPQEFNGSWAASGSTLRSCSWITSGCLWKI